MSKGNDKAQELFDQLEEGVLRVYTSEGYLSYLSCMAKFHDYSVRNCILIFLQMPTATFCAGYNTWKSKFNRQVLAGSKSIKIIGGRKAIARIEEEDEKTGAMKKVKHEYMKYFPVSIFDVSQTEGDELVSSPCKNSEGDVEGCLEISSKLVEGSPVPVSFEGIEDPELHGFFNREEKRIVVRNDMSQSQTIKTLVHEIAHSKLHAKTDGKQRGHREVEAESVAYIVCARLGIDTASYSFPYIATWAKDKEASEQLESQAIILKAANEIIETLGKEAERVRAA